MMVFFLGSWNDVAFYFILMCTLQHLFDELLAMVRVLCEWFLFGASISMERTLEVMVKAQWVALVVNVNKPPTLCDGVCKRKWKL